jgi:hypothetical protein
MFSSSLYPGASALPDLVPAGHPNQFYDNIADSIYAAVS